VCPPSIEGAFADRIGFHLLIALGRRRIGVLRAGEADVGEGGGAVPHEEAAGGVDTLRDAVQLAPALVPFLRSAEACAPPIRAQRRKATHAMLQALVLVPAAAALLHLADEEEDEGSGGRHDVGQCALKS